MIEFDDLTLREANGKFEEVSRLMKEDGAGQTWMLKSQVFIHFETATSIFIVGFWNDGKVIITEMMRPLSIQTPNDDVIKLSEWTKENGWKLPEPSNRLLDSKIMYDFWERQYQSGLISCPMMEEKEKDLHEKLIKLEEENINVI